MHHEIVCSWLGKMEFEGDVMGHKIRLDDKSSFGSKDSGPSPKRLLLLALAGCTGMDIVPMLEKMRVPISGLRITVDAEGTDVDPRVYTRVRILYEFSGIDLEASRTKIARAVSLSQEKYCGVSAMLHKAMDIQYEILFVPTLP